MNTGQILKDYVTFSDYNCYRNLLLILEARYEIWKTFAAKVTIFTDAMIRWRCRKRVHALRYVTQAWRIFSVSVVSCRPFLSALCPAARSKINLTLISLSKLGTTNIRAIKGNTKLIANPMIYRYIKECVHIQYQPNESLISLNKYF